MAKLNQAPHSKKTDESPKVPISEEKDMYEDLENPKQQCQAASDSGIMR